MFYSPVRFAAQMRAAFVRQRSNEMDSSVISERVNASAEFDLFLVNRTTVDLFVDKSNNEIVLHATRVAHSRCCRLTEGVYTLMGCISVTLFFLGVATIKFLRYVPSTDIFIYFIFGHFIILYWYVRSIKTNGNFKCDYHFAAKNIQPLEPPENTIDY